jgi:hypothetical protein
MRRDRLKQKAKQNVAETGWSEVVDGCRKEFIAQIINGLS